MSEAMPDELDMDWDDFENEVEECDECGRLANRDVCKERVETLAELEKRTALRDSEGVKTK